MVKGGGKRQQVRFDKKVTMMCQEAEVDESWEKVEKKVQERRQS